MTDTSKPDKERERQERVIAELGAYPDTAREYVALAARKFGATISYRGSIKLDHLHGYASSDDLSRDVRILASELKLTLSKPDINDAVRRYIVDQRDGALHDLRMIFQKRREFDWHELVTQCFDTRHVGKEFVVAVLRHFVWQVQRKLAGQPVFHHLMPVLHGRQGGGKTYFIERFVAPLIEVTGYADFGQIADERMIDLWRNFILVLDEMAKASKTDIETVKHVITAQTLERRPMRTNAMVTIPQNATFVGASNHRVAEMIRDDTGNRRNVELFYVRPVDDDYLSTVDWHSAWSSVQAEDPAPILAVAEQLAEQQAEARHHGPVEYWLMHLGPVDLELLRRLAGGDDLVSTRQLYEAYVDHRREVTSGHDHERRTEQTFAHELHRITDADDKANITKARTKTRNGWRIAPAAERSTGSPA